MTMMRLSSAHHPVEGAEELVLLHIHDAALHVTEALRRHLAAQLGYQVLTHRREAIGVVDLARDDLCVTVIIAHRQGYHELTIGGCARHAWNQRSRYIFMGSSW